jgi:signal transduction histidine kinase
MTPDPADPDRTANHLALLARWADELAHEIKNPFHAMVINLELVKRRAGEDAEGARERAQVVESEIHRVHGLIDSLLTLARPWPATETAHVGTVLDALLPVFRARATLHHITFEHEPGDGPAAVALPPADLALVLLNLVDNAIDAAREGAAGPDEAGEGRWIRVAWEPGEDAVVVRVTDSGPGFGGLDGDPFDAGVGRAGRDGLGLAVSRALLEAAGGTLGVEGDGADGDPTSTTLAATLPR